jgi:hypothetical protein
MRLHVEVACLWHFETISVTQSYQHNMSTALTPKKSRSDAAAARYQKNG